MSSLEAEVYKKPTIGTRYGKLEVIGSHGIKSMRLRCDCGVIQYSPTKSLLEGNHDGCRRCMGKNPIPGVKVDLTGQVFGKWTVISRKTADRKGGTKYECKCECGTMHDVWGTHLTRGNSKSCHACTVKSGKDHAQFTGVGDISGDWWDRRINRHRKTTKRCSLEVTITKEYAWELFLQQDRKCKLTGLPLTISNDYQINTASIDRIDSAIGYVPGNIQWLHKDVNMLKNTYDQDYFIKLCTLVSNHAVSLTNPLSIAV